MAQNYNNHLILKIFWCVFSPAAHVDPAVTVVQCLDRQISKILYVLRGDIKNVSQNLVSKSVLCQTEEKLIKDVRHF